MEVQLVTRDDCAFCDVAKEMLGGLSTEYGFAVRVLELDSPEGASLAERGGVMFPPGVFIDGEPFSYGRVSEKKLRRELGRRTDPVGRT